MTPGSVDGSAVKTGVSKVLPPYMVPSVVLSMDSIPTTLSGKADHHTLLSLLVESKAVYISGGIYSSHEEYMVPNSPLEEAVLAIYRKELQSEGMGMASDFFESGGDSLKAVHIVTSLHALYRKFPELQTHKGFSNVSVTDILQQHTPGAIVQSCFGSSLSIQQLAQKAPIMPRPAGMRRQAPASFQQTALHAAEHLSSRQRTDYNVLIAFGAIGDLNITALKKALSFLWRRHQVLRTGLIFQVPQFLIFFTAVTQFLYV